MKTTARFLAVLLFLSMGLYAQAQEDTNSGNYLYKTWKATEKETNNITVSVIEAYFRGYFFGFVNGVSDALMSLGVIYFPEGVTNGQTYRVVGKYLEDHPESLHEPAIDLAARALVKAFPPKKK
jgi:hypothetical protein